MSIQRNDIADKIFRGTYTCWLLEAIPDRGLLG